MNDVPDPSLTQNDNVSPNTDTAQVSRAVRAGSEGKIIVADKFEIDTTRPAPEFEHPFAEAFECSGDGKSNDCIALVIKGRYPARHNVIKVALQNDIPGLIIMRTTAIAEWKPDNTQRFTIIYRRPAGSPLYNTRTQKREVISEDVLRRNIIRPIFFALRNLSDRGIYHGNIRPDNIFFSGSENAEACLGDCASSIPGIIQPAVYETIERAMADQHGRGAGTPQDDIYAFGATVAILYRGDDPFEGKSDRFIVEDKINRSSFSAFTDGMRLSPGLSEFLRATLNDDPKQRWTIDQVSLWVDGTRTTPKQTVIGQRAQRVIEFNGKKYIRPRLLARDLGENISEAVGLIETGYLSKWIERALGDHERLEVVNEAIAFATAGGKTQGYEDRLVCFVSMALDPKSPLRYKGVSVYPNGLGYSLAYSLMSGLSIQPYAEIIRDRFAWNWLGYKENVLAETNDLLRKFEIVSKLIIRRGINFGLERCIYELAPHVPCLSDLLRSYYVLDGKALLYALDSIAVSQKSNKPIDRHIASFICVHDTHDNNGLMSSIDSGDKIKYSLALLALYQGLQKRADNGKFIDLCEWLYKEAEVIIQRFYNLNIKQEMIKTLTKEMKTGNLRGMLAVVDNPIQVRKDFDDFQKATNYYKSLGTERDRIRQELDRNSTYGQGSGQHIAMVISAILSGVIIVSLIVRIFLTHISGG
jgi:hypothetical protein